MVLINRVHGPEMTLPPSKPMMVGTPTPAFARREPSRSVTGLILNNSGWLEQSSIETRLAVPVDLCRGAASAVTPSMLKTAMSMTVAPRT
jgi:hypothetical protein